MDIFLPSMAGFSTIIVCGSLLYYKIRKSFSVKANCWFCNKNFKVPFKNRNSFVCVYCQQYNGFKEDGDYNCDIPALYSEDLNFSWNKTPDKNTQHPYENGLCQLCNLNQVLKMRALSDFSPVDESNFDVELEEFKKRLEDIYGLCRECEAVLHQTLGKQNSWLKPKLISWRLENSRKLLLKGASFVSNRPKSLKRVGYSILLLISLMLSLFYIEELKMTSISIYLKNAAPYAFPYYSIFYQQALLFQNIGAFISLLTTLLLSKNVENCDSCSCLSWTLLLISSSFEDLLKNYNINMLQFVLCIITVILTFWAAVLSFRQSFKSTISSHSYGSLTPEKSFEFSFEKNNSINHSDIFSSASINGHKQENRKTFSRENISEEAKCDLRSNLDSLKIGTPKKNVIPDNFNPKSLFTEKDTSTPKYSYLRESLLAPSRLGNKIVTQSSWVAGGYWGNTGSPRRATSNDMPQLDEVKRPLFSISRSSSQSSGFVSHVSGKTSSDSRNPFSSFPNSRQPSLCGDRDNGDRASLFSEPLLNHRSSVSSEGFPISSRSQRCGPLDAQSACSTYTQFSSASHSPSANSVYYNPLNNSAKPGCIKEENLDHIRDSGFLRQCNPWMAFILGLSISANVFLFFIIFKFDVLSGSIKLKGF